MQEPQPQLAELLRTCVHPPSLLLQIVHIEFLDVKDQRKSFGKPLDGDSPNVSDETHRYAVKYILSDGEIMMQALLHRKLTGLRDVADVAIGDLLDIRHFAVKKSPRLDGHGHVAYLAIEDCHFLHRIVTPKRALNEEKEGVKTDNSRKRKRTHSHSDVVVVDGGARSHTSTTEMTDKTERPPAKRPSLHHGPGLSATGVASAVEQKQPRPDRARQPAHMNALTTLRRSTFLPPASGQVQTKEEEEVNAASITKDRSDEKDSRSVLKNIFGARQIILDGEEDDFFEALPTDQTTIKRRRRVLQKLDGNTSFNSQVSSVQDDPHRHDDRITPSKPPKSEAVLPDKIPAAVNHDQEAPQLHKESVRDGTFALSQAPTFYKPQEPPLIASKPQPPPQKVQTQPIPSLPTQPAVLPSPPFHTLSSLRNPSASQNLPAKSYTLTTLAVISWTGTTTIHRPGSLFPPKRHLKIIDPSLATSRPPSRQIQARQSARDPNPSSFRAQNSFQDAVTVAVYIDAANFKPESGTLVLFRGLVMQRLVNGDIILNAYGRLKDQRFEEVTDKTDDVVKEEGINEGNVSEDRDSGRPKHDSHWFITDHSKIRSLGYGSRLDYYLDWWAERQRVREQPAQT